MERWQVARFASLMFIPAVMAGVMVLSPSAASAQDLRATSLQTGAVEERRRVLTSILRRPSSERTLAEWRALADELSRVELLVHDSSTEVGSDSPVYLYWVDLVMAVGQSRDPAVIPLLLASIDARVLGEEAAPAMNGLARFGDAAIAGLSGVIEHGRDDGVGIALLTLTAILDGRATEPGHPLSQSGRRAIVEVAREIWRPGVLTVPVSEAAEMALATGDAALREQVLRLTRGDSPALVARGLTKAEGLETLAYVVQRRTRRRLTDLEALRTGDEIEKQNAAFYLKSEPPGDRSHQAWKAVGDALIRRRKEPPLTGLGPEADVEDVFRNDLIDILEESRDPIVIDPLLSVLDITIPANALARFGDLPAQKLIHLARTGAGLYKSGALAALAWFLDHPVDDPVRPLSPAVRRQIVSFAREAWRVHDVWVLSRAALALSAGDPELRQEVIAAADSTCSVGPA